MRFHRKQRIMQLDELGIEADVISKMYGGQWQMNLICFHGNQWKTGNSMPVL